MVGAGGHPQHHDKMDVGLMCRWFLHRGVAAWLRAAIFMMQMCSCIRFSIAGCRRTMMMRGRGSLTGSRVAGCCGAAIVADMMAQISKIVRPYEWGGSEFLIASWIDNLYAAGASAASACHRLIACANYLRSEWRLEFKPSSMRIIGSSRSAQDCSCGKFSVAIPLSCHRSIGWPLRQC